jgi:HlyD family secretion protein
MLHLAFWSALEALILVAIPAQALDIGPNNATDQKAVAGAPGRIEGSEEPVAIGASITGIVEKVAVHQGDLVSKGDLLVRMDCKDIKAQVAMRIAEYTAAKAIYRKLVNGPRPEEIKIAEADLELAKARVAEARARKARSSTLLNSAAGNRATADVDERDVGIAEAQLESARLRLQLLKAGTREEDLAEAEAKMISAGHTVDATMAELAKYEVRSPINGIVLRKEVSEGELVSVFYPKPLLMLSEIGKYRVRAEVDEHDIAKIKLGQSAVIVVNALGQKQLRGHVAKIALVMGRRKILTSDPADKSDRDVMEVIVDLDEKPENLPIGLRVSVIFLE